MMRDAENTFESEASAFRELLPKLLGLHEGKYALIHERMVRGIFDDMRSAYESGRHQFGLAIFFIGRVVEHEVPVHIPALTHGLIHARL